MGNITLSFTVQGDSEGYVTFECPYCGSEFKLQAGEVQSDEEPVLELFCPYCGLAKEKSAFWSKDVRDKARALAENYMIEELNKAFGKMARSINRQKSIIKMTYKPLKKVYVKELKNADTAETEFQNQSGLLDEQDYTSEDGQNVTVYPTLLVMDDPEFSDWAGKEVSLNSDYLDCVMITSTYLYNAGSYTQLKNALNLQPGFSMEFAQENGFADTWHVAALAEDFPYSGNTVTSNTVESLTLQLVTSRSVFQAFLNRQADLGRSGAYYWQVQYIHPESISALTSGLEEWSLNNSYGLPQGVISANYNSLAMGGLQRFGMLLQILCTGFVLLLCLVCMANIHNSLSTGMELRAREYGILRSVGITPVDFRKMIWLESLFYGIKAMCWSLPFGMGVLALEYYAIRRAFQLPFCLPVGSIVLAVVLVMGVCWISGLLTRRSLEEQTITEAIQKKLF